MLRNLHAAQQQHRYTLAYLSKLIVRYCTALHCSLESTAVHRPFSRRYFYLPTGNTTMYLHAFDLAAY